MRLAAALAILGLPVLAGVTGCDNVSIVMVEDARVFREPDNGLVVDVDLRAAQQSGRTVGPYCVSAHVVPFGFDPDTPGLSIYRSQLEVARVCASDLGDGDSRTIRIVLSRKDIAAKNPIRVQTQRGKGVDDWMAVEAP